MLFIQTDSHIYNLRSVKMDLSLSFYWGVVLSDSDVMKMNGMSEREIQAVLDEGGEHTDPDIDYTRMELQWKESGLVKFHGTEHDGSSVTIVGIPIKVVECEANWSCAWTIMESSSVSQEVRDELMTYLRGQGEWGRKFQPKLCMAMDITN